MSKKDKKQVSTKVKPSNLPNNRIRRIKTEIHKCEKKLQQLLKRGVQGKKGGIIKNNTRYDKLISYINNLKQIL